MLFHVYFLPFSGISCSPRLLITSLKIMISFMLPPALFLSVKDL
uniref:Uncharacterized protein n=1 Tax=Arundo donax TaxID=35708 RepID=A0A0A9ASL8_ARUDO